MATLGFIPKLTYSQAPFWRKTSSSSREKAKHGPGVALLLTENTNVNHANTGSLCQGHPTLLQHAACPQTPPHRAQRGTIVSLSSGFKNSTAVGRVIFGAQNWRTTHTYKTNKEYVRAKETLYKPKATRCSPSIIAPESARAFPVTVHKMV